MSSRNHLILQTIALFDENDWLLVRNLKLNIHHVRCRKNLGMSKSFSFIIVT